MASTPSASALSAVLRCRGKIWTRNPPTKRPPAAPYGHRVPGAALREAPSSSWEAFRRGERVFVAGGLAVEYRAASPHVTGKTDSWCGPRGSEPLPRRSEPLPRRSEPLPRRSEPLPRGSEPLPRRSEPLPRGSEPLPRGSEPLPRRSEPLPRRSEPLLRLLLRLSSALSGQPLGLPSATPTGRHQPGPGAAAGVLKVAVRSRCSVLDAGSFQRTVRGGWSGLRSSLLSTGLPIGPAAGSGPGRPEDGAPSAVTRSPRQRINNVASADDETSCRRIIEDRPD